MNKQHATFAPVISIAIGVVFSITVLAVTICSPATIPLWCAAHGGCP